MKFRHLSVLFLASLPGFLLSCGSSMDTVTVNLGGEKFVLEVARTPEEQRQGLMNRKSLEPNRGMIFIYERDSRLSFWMKNTTIPLSIAFISKDGTIREIYDMKPLSTRSIESTHSVRYALEVNRGTFERLGLAPGDRIELPDL